MTGPTETDYTGLSHVTDLDEIVERIMDAEMDKSVVRTIIEEHDAEVVAEKDAWKQLAEGLDGLCSAYRTGSRRTPEKALDKISDARAKLAAIQEVSDE